MEAVKGWEDKEIKPLVNKEEKMATSPIIQTRMNFGNALKAAVEGKKMRRVEWPKDGTYLVIEKDQLMIYKPSDKQLHALIVTTGDILGVDWIIA